jgi:bifunctional ADP-heptose synthase (sugar kinase/adenylyltransferase)
MTRTRLAGILESLARVRAGVIGDFCLDAYWDLDTGPAEPSLETGKPTRGVRRQRYSLGGAGNVVNNLTALGAGAVYGFSVISDDLFGRELLALLRDRNVDVYGLVKQDVQWDTPVYAKPYCESDEQERFDFGRWNLITPETELKLTGALRTMVPELDVLIVNQQLSAGVYSPSVIDGINRIAHGNAALLCVLDARTMSDRFTGMVVKLNAAEVARIGGSGTGVPARGRSGDDDPAERSTPHDVLRERALALAAHHGKPVYVTRSDEGILLCDRGVLIDLPAIPLTGPSDPVGAGDTSVAAIALALAAGATPIEAGELANLAAAVTVRKLRQTGTATPAEILAMFDKH